MKAYELFQIDRGRGELRCAVAARHRDRSLDHDSDAVARVLDGPELVVDPRDKSIAEHLLVCGFWEWWISQAIADCMRPGTICVDVGANAGYFAALFCSLGAARTIAIEPHPELARRLRQSAARNGWTGVEVVEAAVGDHAGHTELLVHSADNLGGSCVVDVARPGSITVPLRTLDQVLGDLAPIQVLKMDCEGSEPRIWRGMRGVLDRNPDLHVFAEVTVNTEAAPWLAEVAREFPLRFVDYDGSLQPLDVTALVDRPLWMVYLHRD